MKDLILNATEECPKVDFRVQDSSLIISGFSIMAEAKSFYRELIDWVNTFGNEKRKETSVLMEFTELNQGSLKMLLFFCQELKALELGGNKISVNWNYNSDNEQMKEAGQDLSYLTDLDFNFKAVKVLEAELV